MRLDDLSISKAIIEEYGKKLIDFKRNKPYFGWTVFSMVLGQVLIYAFGIWWLAISLKLNLVKAVYLGFIPFLPGAAFKLITASVIYTKFSSTR